MSSLAKLCESAQRIMMIMFGIVGSFGYVFKIKRKSDGKILCWKELDYGIM